MEGPGDGREIEGVSSVYGMITKGKGDWGKEWDEEGVRGESESEVGSIWCGWVARGDLDAVGWLGAAGSRPGTPG